jgi:hypothetical protein
MFGRKLDGIVDELYAPDDFAVVCVDQVKFSWLLAGVTDDRIALIPSDRVVLGPNFTVSAKSIFSPKIVYVRPANPHDAIGRQW